MKTMITILSVSVTMANLAFAAPGLTDCCRRCPCNDGGHYGANFASQDCDCIPDSDGGCTCDSYSY